MSKHEVEIAAIRASSKKFDSGMETFRYALLLAAVVAAIWVCFDGVHKLTDGRDAETISAISAIINALELGSVLGYIVAAICGVGWYVERKGKKRAIIQKSSYQKMVEANDPYRPTSGLTETGDTPVG